MLTICVAAALTLPLNGSCSDDAPASVDAQLACNCPEAEPPLAGRIVRVIQTTPVAAGEPGGTTAVCPTDGVLLGGGCEAGTPDRQMLLLQAHPLVGIPEFSCLFDNTDTINDNTIVVTAICLVPPE